MSHRLWTHRITDILDSIKKIQSYVEDMEFDDFNKDEKTIKLSIQKTTKQIPNKSLEKASGMQLKAGIPFFYLNNDQTTEQ